MGSPANVQDWQAEGEGQGKGGAYEQHRKRTAAAQSEKSRAGRDIAPLPAVVNPERKEKCRSSLEAFCRIYLPKTFNLPWSPDHRKAIERIEGAVLGGGLFAYAMPRGTGKTSLAVAGYLWALLYGLQEFVFTIGSDEGKASSLLESGKSELECNDLLYDDFPEACYPIRKLDGIAQRANGKLFEGKRTHVGWTATEIVLPSIPGSKCSSGIVRVSGITGGGIRGTVYVRPDGKKVRPGLVIIDDPQTNASAEEPDAS